ncbi:hypothetical protein ENUP19_0367G0011 [Entamoeba nuttalli]|uniref:C2 NT-type domain-containing protein n=2 Tax=Entamoeba nuttalli TaxID=412467 RepID=K2H584_ENTNP|nr:hypothetical protein ENU1_051480 [Entamoeba nuttalli P19]EKE41562.1 hypothetical protein ENU1_051480 [Entamoeba nuttalli P19]|eukprot:XP_008856104.1 hypothetical protein ENU1_051480 [Entamoeba nuttalli P19]
MFRRKRNIIKYTFTVEIKRVIGVKKYQGHTLFIKWWRGSKSKSGVLKRSLVKEDEALWNSSFTFDTKLQPRGNDGFKPKQLVLSIYVVKTSSEILIGRVKLDLAQYIDMNDKIITFPFTEGECKKGQVEACLFSAEKGSTISISTSLATNQQGLNNTDKKNEEGNPSLCSETTIETSFHDSVGSLNELIKQRDELKVEFDENEEEYGQLCDEIDNLQAQIDELGNNIPFDNVSFLSPSSYNFLFEKVLFNTNLNFIEDQPEIAIILFNRIHDGDEIVKQENDGSDHQDEMTEGDNLEEGYDDTVDIPFVSLLFAIINGIVRLSSGSPTRLCYWLSTILRLYAMIHLARFDPKRKRLSEMCQQSIESCISMILTSIIDYSISKTEPYVSDIFLNPKTRLQNERVFNSVLSVLNEMNNNHIDVIFKEEYVKLYFRYLDRYLFNYILHTSPSINVEIALNILMQTARTRSLIPSELKIQECFNLTGNVAKIIQLNLESFQPNELFSQINAINPQSMFEIIKKITPPLKKAIITKYQQAVLGQIKVIDIDPYASVSIDKTTLDKFLFKQN